MGLFPCVCLNVIYVLGKHIILQRVRTAIFTRRHCASPLLYVWRICELCRKLTNKCASSEQERLLDVQNWSWMDSLFQVCVLRLTHVSGLSVNNFHKVESASDRNTNIKGCPGWFGSNDARRRWLKNLSVKLFFPLRQEFHMQNRQPRTPHVDTELTRISHIHQSHTGGLLVYIWEIHVPYPVTHTHTHSLTKNTLLTYHIHTYTMSHRVG